MQDTPRTDEAEKDGYYYAMTNMAAKLVLSDFARDLERELADTIDLMHKKQNEFLDAYSNAAARATAAEAELDAAKRAAESLATSIHRSEYSDVTQWELCDSVAGVISQIDNMYAGVRKQRDEAREKIPGLEEK